MIKTVETIGCEPLILLIGNYWDLFYLSNLNQMLLGSDSSYKVSNPLCLKQFFHSHILRILWDVLLE